MRIQKLAMIFLAVSAVSACNINVQRPLSESGQHAAATIVAQTMQAAANATAAALPGAQATAPYTKPMLAITGNSNCRSGPSTGFQVVTAFTPGTDLEIIGRDSANNFWQVKIPNSQDTCWVWGQHATARGSLDNLPGPAPTQSGGAVPARPGSLFYTYECPFGNLTTTLTWSDSANNEAGYHVYRFDLLIADLPPNSTTYTDNETVTPGTALQYSVAAYNPAGESAKRTESFSCR